MHLQREAEITWIPAGSASVIESVFPEEGIYVAVDRNMADVVKGGAFVVQATKEAQPDDRPPGTWVPSKAVLNEQAEMMEG